MISLYPPIFLILKKNRKDRVYEKINRIKVSKNNQESIKLTFNFEDVFILEYFKQLLKFINYKTRMVLKKEIQITKTKKEYQVSTMLVTLNKGISSN